jgi:hypothetical protein
MRIIGLSQRHLAHALEETFETICAPGYPNGTTRNVIHRFHP